MIRYQKQRIIVTNNSEELLERKDKYCRELRLVFYAVNHFHFLFLLIDYRVFGFLTLNETLYMKIRHNTTFFCLVIVVSNFLSFFVDFIPRFLYYYIKETMI